MSRQLFYPMLMNRLSLWWLWMLVALPTWLQAQAPCFEVVPRKGCVPLTITVQNCSAAANIAYSYDGVTSSATTFTFTTIGTKTVTQFVGGAGGGSSLSITVEVVNPRPALFSLEACNGRGVAVLFGDTTFYDRFRVNFGDGSPSQVYRRHEIPRHTYAVAGTYEVVVVGLFLDVNGNLSQACGREALMFSTYETLPLPVLDSIAVTAAGQLRLHFATFPNVGTELVESIAPFSTERVAKKLRHNALTDTLINRLYDRESYRYRIRIPDRCAGTSTTTPLLSPVWIRTQPGQGQIRVSWPTYTAAGFAQAALWRNGRLLQTFLSPHDTVWTDRDVACGPNYCYELVVRLTQGPVSRSNQACARISATGLLPQAARLYASVEGESIVVRWTENAANISRRLITRQTAGTPDAVLSGTTAGQYRDGEVRTGIQAYCYQVRLEDDCDNFSQTQRAACTMWMQGERAGANNLLRWTQFSGFDGPFGLVLERLDAAGNVLSTDNIHPDSLTRTDPPDRQQVPLTRYRLRAFDPANPANVAYSNVVLVQDKLDIEIPDAFTPNQDGLNDELEIFSRSIFRFDLEIRNRWNEVVFRGGRIEDKWDGRVNGQPAPAGPYAYVLRGQDVLGKPFELKGVVLLLR